MEISISICSEFIFAEFCDSDSWRFGSKFKGTICPGCLFVSHSANKMMVNDFWSSS